EHDVHHADTADAERERANKSEQNFQPDRDAVDDRSKFIAAEHLECLGICRRELLPCCYCREHLRHRPLLKLGSDGLEDHHLRVLRIPKIAGGREGNPDRLVVGGKVVTQLNLAGHYADHGEAHTGNQNGLTHGWSTAEQLFAHAPAQEAHTATFQLIAGIDPAPFGWNLVAHLPIFRADTANSGCTQHAIAVG